MAMMNMGWMKGSGNDAANYFMGVDYYLDENQQTYWLGKDAHRAGLEGLVTKENLKAVLSNRHANGGKLTQRNTDGRRAGLEVVVSEPKTVSMMYAFGDNRIMDAHKHSMNALFNEMQRLGAYRRLRTKGQDSSVYTGSLVGAMFTHTLGRPTKGGLNNGVATPDFQLHTHMLLANATYDAQQGKWYALDGDFLLKHSDYFRAFYRATMANQLQMLGYQLEIKNGNYEIAGLGKIPDKFSNRRAEINEFAEERNIKDRSKLGVMTREKKSDKFTWEQLQAIWRGRLGEGEFKQITDVYLRSLGIGDLRQHDAETKLLSHKYTDKAMEELTHKTTYVAERKLITRALQMGLGKVSVEHIERYIRGDGDGWIRQKRAPWKLTTKDAFLKNIEVKDLWKAGLGKYEKLGRDLYTVKAPGKPHLEALNKLYGSRDRFTSMRGKLYKNPAMGRAAADLNAGIVQDLNNLPKEEVWFVSKVDDGDLPGLLKAAVEQDKRIVFWGDNEKSRLEEELRIEPLRLYQVPEPVRRASKRLKQAVLTLIQRSRDDLTLQRADRHPATREPSRDRAAFAER